MSGTPKFSPIRTWAKPHTDKGTNGDELRSSSGSDPQSAEDRKAVLKRAAFFVTVAILFVLVNHVGYLKNSSQGNASAGFPASVNLTVLPLEPVAGGIALRFVLSNRGNHSVFYPVGAGTNAPVGRIVARASPSSEWVILSGNSGHGVSAIQQSMDSNVAWIEMPPGGSVEGEFHEEGQFHGEHAYAIFLKQLPSANAVMTVSNSYVFPANELRDYTNPVQ